MIRRRHQVVEELHGSTTQDTRTFVLHDAITKQIVEKLESFVILDNTISPMNS